MVTLEGKDASGNDVTITLGTAAKKTVGTGSGNVADLNSSGQFSTGRIPNLSATKITSGTAEPRPDPKPERLKDQRGTLATAMIANLAASKITSGALATVPHPEPFGYQDHLRDAEQGPPP